MVCNKCYETTKNDNLLYGLRLTEINFINEEISAQQLHIVSIFECKNQYRECVLSILNYAPHFTRHKIKNATDFVKKYHQNLDHIPNIYFTYAKFQYILEPRKTQGANRSTQSNLKGGSFHEQQTSRIIDG